MLVKTYHIPTISSFWLVAGIISEEINRLGNLFLGIFKFRYPCTDAFSELKLHREQTTARSAERVNWKSGHTQLCTNQRCLPFGPSLWKVLRPRRTCLGPINRVGSTSDRTYLTTMGRRVQFRWFCASNDSCNPSVHEKGQDTRVAR